jgi:6-phosphogluconolactonase
MAIRTHFPALIALAAALTGPAFGADLRVLLGTNGSGPGIGFSLAHFDPANGRLTRPVLLCEAEDPGFFVIRPDGRRLYACNSGAPSEVSAYRLESGTGRLALLDRLPSGGTDPCYISLDRSGRFALVANYDSGNISVFAIDEDGGLGRRTAFRQDVGSSLDPKRQAHAYAHSIAVDPSNRFVLVADLGTDKVYVYRFDASAGTLVPNEPAFARVLPGSGPRHLSFHPSGRWVYVIDEMASNVTAFRWDQAHGVLTEFQTITTLPADFRGVNTAAEIEVHPSGRFLYCSNRGFDSIAEFAIDAGSGRLGPPQFVSSGGRTPRFFTLDPTGQWILCCNQDSGNVVVFRVDRVTGLLTRAGDAVPARIPVCIGFVPTLP